MASELQSEDRAAPWFVRLGGWVEERTHLRDGILPIIQHPVPKDVNWYYVLGSATLVSFIVQVVTGVILAFEYVPDTNDV
jgi:ubiquinol-cytochrome c reductase cytochrome b subunit